MSGEAGRSEMNVEPLNGSNVAELIELFSAVDAEHFAHATPEAAARFLGEAADIHVLGRVRGRVVAFGMLRGWQDGYEVPSLGIAVRRDLEGRGHGRAMMIALEDLARQRGATRIRLRVHPRNVPARRLYESCGYREAGEERGETVMLRDLTMSPVTKSLSP